MQRGTAGILIVAVAVVAMASMGCKEARLERSPIMSETVSVRQLLYMPARHGMGVGPTFNFTGDGGLGIAVTSVNVREKHSIVFECQHGQFVVEREKLWSRLHEDSTYTCRYVELYQTVYDNDTLVSRTLTDYDFLGLEEFPDLMESPDPRYQQVE